MQLSQRIEKAIQYAGISKAELARKCGVSAPAVTRWMDGSTTNLKHESLLSIAENTGVSVQWLMGGKGSMLEESDVYLKAGNGETFGVYRAEELNGDDIDHDSTFVEIPRLSIIVDGGSGKTEFGTEYKEPVSFLYSFLEAQNINPKSAACLYVSGEDMRPTVNDNDLILIDLDKTAPADGVYLVRLGEHSVKICRTEAHYSGALKIRYDNRPNYEEMIPADQMDKIEIVAKVVWKGGLVR